MGLKLLQRIFFDITKLRGGKKGIVEGNEGKKPLPRFLVYLKTQL
jgi:hypothetical protein